MWQPALLDRTPLILAAVLLASPAVACGARSQLPGEVGGSGGSAGDGGSEPAGSGAATPTASGTGSGSSSPSSSSNDTTTGSGGEACGVWIAEPEELVPGAPGDYVKLLPLNGEPLVGFGYYDASTLVVRRPEGFGEPFRLPPGAGGPFDMALGGGFVHTIARDDVYSDVRYARAADDLATAGDATSIVGEIAQESAIAASDEGDVAVLVSLNPEVEGLRLALVVSDDGGVTFAPPRVVEIGGYGGDVRYVGSRLFLVWYDNEFFLHTAYSDDGGITLQGEVVFDGSAAYGAPALYDDGAGGLVVTWTGFPSEDEWQYLTAHIDVDTGEVGQTLLLAENGDGRLCGVYAASNGATVVVNGAEASDGSTTVSVRRSFDGGATFEPAETLKATPPDADGFPVDTYFCDTALLAPDGSLYLAWADAGGLNVYLQRFHQNPCP